MKYKINKKEFEGLDENIQKFYVRVGKEYVLDIEDLPTLDEDLEELSELRNEVIELRKKSEDGSDLKFERLKRRYEALEEKYNGVEKEYKGKIENMLIDNEVGKICGELSTTPRLLEPHVRKNIKVEFDEKGEASFVYHGPDGKISPTRDDFKKSFASDKDFESIIKREGFVTEDKVRTRTVESKFETKADKPLAQMSVDELVAFYDNHGE